MAYVDALSAALAGSSGDLTVVAHSFAVHPVAAALAHCRVPCRLVLVAPVLDLLDGHRAIACLASAALRERDGAAADAIDAGLQRAVTFFDDAMRAALTAASADRHLFERYWRDRRALALCLDTWQSSPDSAFDLTTFTAILEDLHARAWSIPALPGVDGVHVVLGGADPIVGVTAATEVLRRWAPGCATTVFEGAGHWAHLEAPQRFCDVLQQQA